GSTTSCVTLHRPPPAMRIFAPIFAAPSMANTRFPGALRAAKIAAIKPAAPPPTTAISHCTVAEDLIRIATGKQSRQACQDRMPLNHQPGVHDAESHSRGVAFDFGPRLHARTRRGKRERHSDSGDPGRSDPRAGSRQRLAPDNAARLRYVVSALR